MRIERLGRAGLVLGAALFLAGCVTIAPAASPTALPTVRSTTTPKATATPSLAPTTAPTTPPTEPPTAQPTAPPTLEPTISPTPEPTAVSTATELDPNQGARYGSRDPLDFDPATQPDPQSVTVVSGGPVDATYLGDDCTGYTEPNPDYEVRYEAGSSTLLRIYFIPDTAGDDATLVINDTTSQWHCSDDEYGTSNPSIDFSPPESGWYDIWIGSYSPNVYLSGTLYITELDSNHP